MHRAELQTRTVVRSLMRLRDRPVPCAVPSEAPRARSGTAVVVGAGPGLADSIEAIKAVRDRVSVFAVNASLAALRKAGVAADWVVVRESLDQSHHLEGGGFHHAALDLACHEAIWDEAAKHVPVPHAFVGAGTQFWQIADALDVRPLYGGTAALTGAVQLAAELGAERIVLVGVDLAVIDSIAYSALSPYGAVKGTVIDDVVRFSDTARWDEGARRVGAVPEPKLQRADLRRCWDGEARPAMHSAQLGWLSMFAGRAARDGIECIDTSARGIEKAGWTHAPNVLRPMRPSSPAPGWSPLTWPRSLPIGRHLVAAFLERLRVDAAWCAEVQGRALVEANLGSGIVESMGAGSTVRGLRLPTAAERLAAVTRGIAEAGRWTREALDGTVTR